MRQKRRERQLFIYLKGISSSFSNPSLPPLNSPARWAENIIPLFYLLTFCSQAPLQVWLSMSDCLISLDTSPLNMKGPSRHPSELALWWSSRAWHTQLPLLYNYQKFLVFDSADSIHPSALDILPPHKKKVKKESFGNSTISKQIEMM